MSIQIKRIYENVTDDDGKRVLVDRIWPRGVSKEKAQLDEWLKEVAPSTELRKEFNHDPERFSEFKKHYKQELNENPVQQEAFNKLLKWSNKELVTLLYASKDETYNHAQVLKKLLK
ncbi:DUF488 domain-containing protein [Aquisalibacillus elongatus]|uniref:Uncharacterized protein YeaO (DUF488 family) n=1 Tax=Aquisalibacillus elongatus TaxID=485577 RepID=A0A3N5B7G1_9BACI|nr:DUF488 domain-containing protein [Aquisalibacillus elongatus]RPF53283.1 uncharacterized protein YeaO (DUF488 family) [Aquisalibacillus elongatus]